jgi:mRNA-degrading endonuclease RelE of RelBE toxin-antitoxin system
MSWVCELTQDAEEDLRKLPRNIQERVTRVLKQLETDPFQGM